MAKRGEIVAGVDFGSREVRVLIAHQAQDGAVRLIGYGSAPSRGGVQEGVVQNRHTAVQAFRTALEGAHRSAGVRVQSLFCGISTRDAISIIREGKVLLTSGVAELEHLDEARHHAEQVALNAGMRNLSSVSSQEWYIDNHRVEDPLGIRGSVLQARMHFAQVPGMVIDNLRAIIESQNCVVEDMVYTPIAAALGCLTPEDMKLGVAVLDFGHSSTGISVYHDRSILGTKTFDWGVSLIVNDLSGVLKVPFDEAMALLHEYGVSQRKIQSLRQEPDDELALTRERIGLKEDRSQVVKLNKTVSGAPATVPRSDLDEIIFARDSELMGKVSRYLNQYNFRPLMVRGIVLAGGGARLKHQAELTEAVCDINTRIGLPEGVDMMPQNFSDPINTPLVGIVRHGFEYRAAVRNGRIDQRMTGSRKVFQKIWHFFTSNFF